MFVALVAALATPLRAGPPTAADLQNIGITPLEAQLGGAMPTGAGITVTQVEAPQSSTAYFVNTALADFAGKTIIDATGGGTISSHATNVAQNLYGNLGVAPGIDTVDVYNANDWLGDGFLRIESSQAPLIETNKIENHSWIANFTNTDGSPDTVAATDAIRRLDYVIDRDGVVAAVGVDNGTATTLPQVFGNAYNAIAVSRSDGGGSLGPSTIDGIGRSKPDIVAPAGNTSTATSWVSAAAALLLQAGSASADAQQPETIKALLMAGASKAPFDLSGTLPRPLDAWSHTPTQPLDLRYGAGQLDVQASYNILAAGEHAASNSVDVPAIGWSYSSISAGGERDYFFTIPAHTTAIPFSTILTWNREIHFTPGIGGNPAQFTALLPNLSLHLYNAVGFSKGSLVDESISTIDNVQHIYEQGLAAGHYVLAVDGNLPTNFALAWDSQVVLDGDANRDGQVTGADYTIWADHFGQTVTPWTNGDFNGDGQVTGADYTIWADNFSPPAAAMSAVLSVPEPSSAVLGAVAAGSAALWFALRRART